MASPRSMWSGNIKLGLVTIPVSIGKAWSEERERGLREICTCHNQPIDRSERCAVTGEAATGKAKGVEVSPENWHAFSEVEYAAIEDKTGSDELLIEDYQKVWDIGPLDFSVGTYYLRYAPPKAKSTSGRDAFAALLATLKANDTAAVLKWCSGQNQRLCVLRPGPNDTLILQQIPFESEVREPGDKERAHLAERVDPAYVKMFHTLLESIGDEGGFNHGRYVNDGVLLRSQAVEETMRKHGGDEGGEQEQKGGEERKQRQVPDLMAQLQASIAEQQEKV